MFRTVALLSTWGANWPVKNRCDGFVTTYSLLYILYVPLKRLWHKLFFPRRWPTHRTHFPHYIPSPLFHLPKAAQPPLWTCCKANKKPFGPPNCVDKVVWRSKASLLIWQTSCCCGHSSLEKTGQKLGFLWSDCEGIIWDLARIWRDSLEVRTDFTPLKITISQCF